MLKVQRSYGAKACQIKCHCCNATARWTVICTRTEKVFETCAEHIDDVLTIAHVTDRGTSPSGDFVGFPQDDYTHDQYDRPIMSEAFKLILQEYGFKFDHKGDDVE